MENFKITTNNQGGFLVKADSERFGKQAIVFEGITYKECLKFVASINEQEAIKLDRTAEERTSIDGFGKMEGVYAKDLMVGEVFVKRNCLICTITNIVNRAKTTLIEYVYTNGNKDKTTYSNDSVIALRENLR